MIRGQFHIFACRSAKKYANKVVEGLKFLGEKRAEELRKKVSLSLHEQSEAEFITELTENDLNVGSSKTVQFDDGEMNVIIDNSENVRDKDVFLVQCPYNTTNNLSVNDNLTETFLHMDALKRAKAKTITLVSLYYPYARGDKQHSKDGVPAKLFSTLLTHAGMNNLVVMDLHADQITGFFDPRDVRIEHLHASPLIIHYFKDLLGEDSRIAAPDAGAAKRVQWFAQNLEKGMIMAYKKRSYDKKHFIDDIKILGLPGKDEVLIVDDIVSSGGSIIKVMEKLKEKGVKKIFVACTHPLLTGSAIEKLDKLFLDKNHPFQKLVGTDAVPHNEAIKSKPWYFEIDTSRFVAKAIFEVHTSGSVSSLHDAHCVAEEDLWVNE